MNRCYHAWRYTANVHAYVIGQCAHIGHSLTHLHFWQQSLQMHGWCCTCGRTDPMEGMQPRVSMEAKSMGSKHWVQTVPTTQHLQIYIHHAHNLYCHDSSMRMHVMIFSHMHNPPCRQRLWTGVVSLCEKLHFMQQQLATDRAVRALRDIQKSSAIKIATWYRGILLRCALHAHACLHVHEEAVLKGCFSL